MRIAIVGSGVAGLTAAHLLAPEHEIVVYEANSYLGGHVHTIEVDPMDPDHHVPLAIDTGFIVFNERNYPCFIRLLSRLGIATRDSDMSFSVRCESTGWEYCGSSLAGLFAQKRNLLRLGFWRILRDVAHFNRRAAEWLAEGDKHGRRGELTLGEFLRQERYSAEFQQYYLLPMGAAIWSTQPQDITAFPARPFLRFFQNHGLLGLYGRPQWRVVAGGSKRYVEALVRPFRSSIRLSTPVERIVRSEQQVEVHSLRSDGARQSDRYDHVILAVHSDQALRLLADPSPAEREVLGAIPYQRNVAVLHTDPSLMPRRKRAWASWNYHRLATDAPTVAVTYWMNRLQSLGSSRQFFVTLNRQADIAPAQIIGTFVYHHPILNAGAHSAQRRHGEISGLRRTHYCGAYWGNGFHEDGVVSAIVACRALGVSGLDLASSPSASEGPRPMFFPSRDRSEELAVR